VLISSEHIELIALSRAGDVQRADSLDLSSGAEDHMPKFAGAARVQPAVKERESAGAKWEIP